MQAITHFILWRLGIHQAKSSITPLERKCLLSHAAGKRSLVEVGVFEGVTTSYLRRAMAADGELTAVDPHQRGRLGFSTHNVIAHAEVDRVSNGSVRWIRSFGVDAAREYKGSRSTAVDFIFFDGDNSYNGLSALWDAWSPLVATGGLVALNDSRSSDARSIDDAGSAVFTRDVILKDSRFKVVEFVETITVLKRCHDGQPPCSADDHLRVEN